ncbi:MAG: phosphoenolpyruvate--protein phosphotransferase [Spirochaetaceae bacterium]|nr:phosphoenolpyruvate--protein phosphotransferase [Spirochaetaceae bacterium]
MKKLAGISGSPGIVIGKALVYLENAFPEIPRHTIQKDEVKSEWKRALDAFEEAVRETRAILDRARREMPKEQADIVEAHLMMLEDEDFRDKIKFRLESRLENIDWIVWDYSHELIQKLIVSSDAYLRERAADVSDVSRRVLRFLLKIKKITLSELAEDVILVVHDLLPLDVLSMRRERVKAIVMDMGSRTSHTAILAQAFGIPAVLGLSNASKEIQSGDVLVADGLNGEVLVGPGEKEIAKYRKAIENYQKKAQELLSGRDLPAETLDGYRVTLKANIEFPEEAERALGYGAEGIGLYRSEFLFLTPGQPAEEEIQYLAYGQVIRVMGGLPVTIRTIDVGGDKVNPEFTEGEKNPLLGWRAIRFCFAQPHLFKTQLRAILRASAIGKVRIMFPMVSGVEELEQALALFDEAKAECRKRKVPFDEDIEVGTMIEIPSAAMTADILAKRSDFFSIGTNDLIQYTIAVDRGNERVGYLAHPAHPAVLRFIKMTIDAAHKRKIKVAMCGELAGDVNATALLLGLGLDEFSMTAASIPRIKRIIRETEISSCRELAKKALACETRQEIVNLVVSWTAQSRP